jgi:DnaJ family protein B protein 4
MGSSSSRIPGQFQFMSSGPGGVNMFSSSSGGPFGSGSSGGGGQRSSRGGGFGGMGNLFGAAGDADEEMFEAGDMRANPFHVFGMNGGSNNGGSGPSSFFQQQSAQQRQQGRPGSAEAWGSPRYQHQQQQQQQQPAVQSVALMVSLEELYKGAVKRLKVTRHVLDAASGKSLPVQEVRSTEIGGLGMLWLHGVGCHFLLQLSCM